MPKTSSHGWERQMTDRITRAVAPICDRVEAYAAGGGYGGKRGMAAKMAVLADMGALLRIVGELAAPNVTVRCPRSIVGPGGEMRLKADHVFIDVIDDQFILECGPHGCDGVVETTGTVKFGLRSRPKRSEIKGDHNG